MRYAVRDLPSAWRATWKPFQARRVTCCILGGLLYGIHSVRPIRTLSGNADSQVVPSGQTLPSRPNNILRGRLFDREPCGGERERAREHQTPIIFGRVEGWAGLEALVSHQPLCHRSHAKTASKDAVQLTGTHLPNQVL